ncbi:MAG: ATP-binding protein [Deltaproteobacteria bacterium]
MKRLIRKILRLLQISPWIAILSIALLTLIIVVFAANNLQRERNHMSQNLLRRSEDIIQFIGIGVRTSLRMGTFGEQQLEQLLEEAAADKENDIAYLLLMDRAGNIVASSNPEIQSNKRPAVQLPLGQRYITRYIDQPGKPQIFELLTAFHPLQRREGPGRMHRRMMRRLEERLAAGGNGSLILQNLLPGPDRKDNYFIIVGLSTEQLASSIRQNYFQIIIMSFVLLIVGLAGWLSLLGAQGYRTSVETLEQMRAFTGLLISRLPAAIAATDQDNRIRVWNPTMENLTGRSAREAIGQSASEVLPKELASIIMGATEREILDREFHLTDVDKVQRILLASALPVTDQQNEYRGGVIVLHDHTELKNLETKVRRHERFAALGKMAAGVAHEVRNPLSSIKGFATLLGGRFPAGSEEAEAAQLLIHEVDRLNRSITELLNYAKPLPLHREATDLGQLVKNTLKLIEGDAREGKVKIRLRVAERLPNICLDRDRISQVLLNLYLNSLQAMEHDGELEVDVKIERDGREFAIIIKDTGAGIAKEHLETILDPYFTTKKEGTGLGLALAAKIIEEHGGSISFDSTPGKGTTATVKFPATPWKEEKIEPQN